MMHNSDFSMDILVSVDKVQPHNLITVLKRIGWGSIQLLVQNHAFRSDIIIKGVCDNDKTSGPSEKSGD